MFHIIMMLFSYVPFCNIPNSYFVLYSEQIKLNNILIDYSIPCHLQCARIKTEKSSLSKMYNLNMKNIYNLHDIIAFRYVFYCKNDMLRFSRTIKSNYKIIDIKNYLDNPKKNGYSALHLIYESEYNECPIKYLECQLYTIDNYYDSVYGKSKYRKKYINHNLF